MKKTFLISCFGLAFQLTFAQTSNSRNTALIKSLRIASNEAIAKQDLEQLSKYWLDDIVIVKGNATHLNGKDAVVAEWKKLFAGNVKLVYIRMPSEIIISNNDTLAWETGTWKAINSYSNGGNYSAMWKKAGTTWKIQAELFVSLY